MWNGQIPALEIKTSSLWNDETAAEMIYGSVRVGVMGKDVGIKGYSRGAYPSGFL